MPHCKSCGTLLDAGDAFCSHCGVKIDHGKGNTAQPRAREPENKLCCELAYSGFLFWLPLLVCPKDKNTRYCANQGLWVLIISVLACWLIRIFGMVNDMLTDTLIGVVVNGFYCLVFIVFLALMGYLVLNCFKRAMEIHRDKTPASILFFEDRAIIR